MLIFFFIYTFFLAHSSDYNSTLGYGCKKGYFNEHFFDTNADNVCKKCSKASGDQLTGCRYLTASLQLYLYEKLGFFVAVDDGVSSFFSGGEINCRYGGGKCQLLSCPTAAASMDTFYNSFPYYFSSGALVTEVYGSNAEFRKMCHYHGCLGGTDRCSYWAIWALIVFLVILILAVVGIVVGVGLCMHHRQKRMREEAERNLNSVQRPPTDQGFPPQAVGYPSYPLGYWSPQQVDPSGQYPPQAYPPQAYPPQAYPPQEYPPPYPQQTYPQPGAFPPQEDFSKYV